MTRRHEADSTGPADEPPAGRDQPEASRPPCCGSLLDRRRYLRLSEAAVTAVAGDATGDDAAVGFENDDE